MLNQIVSTCPVIVLMLGSFAGVATPASLPSWALQFGALGLCGFMIWQNSLRSKSLIKVIDSQQEKMEVKNQRIEKLIDDHTKSNNRLAEALEHRPCLANDRAIEKIRRGP